MRHQQGIPLEFAHHIVPCQESYASLLSQRGQKEREANKCNQRQVIIISFRPSLAVLGYQVFTSLSLLLARPDKATRMQAETCFSLALFFHPLFPFPTSLIMFPQADLLFPSLSFLSTQTLTQLTPACQSSSRCAPLVGRYFAKSTSRFANQLTLSHSCLCNQANLSLSRDGE